MPEPDPDRWTRAYELVLDPLDRDGTFLDGACGDGRLLECLPGWAGRRGLRLEPYGLEADPGLAEAARRRLPREADRIWTGDLLDWTPPLRFDTVRIDPSRDRLEELVRRVLEDLVAPDGRLLLGPYAEDAASYDTLEQVRDWGVPVGRVLEVADDAPGTVSRLLVLPAPMPEATVTSLDEHRRRRSG